MKIANRRRTGFTLIELLVAAALSILIMAIMATAFQTGLGTLSTLKSLGDLAERGKTAETMLRADLEAEHFATGTGDDSPAPMRLSDLRYDLLTPGGSQSAPPTAGYFQIFNETTAIVEGADADTLSCTRAGAGENHRLSISIRRKSRTPEQLFTADLSQLNAVDLPPVSAQSSSDVAPGNRLVSRWAQVDWFLDRSRPTTLDGVNTWPLIRRVRVAGTQNTPLTSVQDTLSVSPATGQLNTAQSLAALTNRLGNSGRNAASISSGQVGDDIVITNVLSFEVKTMWTVNGIPGARTVLPFNAGFVPNGDYPFDDLPVATENTTPGILNTRVFDTMSNAPNWNTPGNANSIPLRIRVIAVQVKIRVYDTKNKLTRQLTVVTRL